MNPHQRSASRNVSMIRTIASPHPPSIRAQSPTRELPHRWQISGCTAWSRRYKIQNSMLNFVSRGSRLQQFHRAHLLARSREADLNQFGDAQHNHVPVLAKRSMSSPFAMFHLGS